MTLFELILRQKTAILTEGITHVEDLILDQGSAGAQKALSALAGLSKDTSTVTVKWDGFPAVVFGRDDKGQLVFMDKHMYDKVVKGKMSFMSIADYDRQRGANRSDLWAKEQTLRPALEKIVPAIRNQFWMGDLMWTGQPKKSGDSFVFKPNTVEYRVKIQSPMGQQIAQNTGGGIAVHTFIPGLGQSDIPLTGLKGLKENAGIVFLVGEMKEKPTVKVNGKLFKEAQAVIKKYTPAVDKFVSDLVAMKGKSVLTAMGPFITSMLEENDIQSNIVPRFLEFLSNKLSPSAQQTFLGSNRDGWLYQQDGGAPGLLGIWSMWAAITQMKLGVKQQIDSQQQGSDVTAVTDGATAHEGYVFGAGKDKLKLIDRLGFSRANFAKHKVPAEEIATKQKMPLAAFCFGRMNPPTLGHELVMKKTVETGGKNSFIFLSNSHQAPDDPLDPKTKAAFISKIYPQYAKHIVTDPVQSPIYAANWLYARGFRNMAFIAGSDRLGKAAGSIEKILNGWNSGPVRSSDNQFGPGGREHVNLIFVSSGERDGDVNSLSGISGSLARKYAAASDQAGFQRATGVGANIKVNGKTLYQATREGMDLANNTAAPDSVKTAARKQAKKALAEAFDDYYEVFGWITPTGTVITNDVGNPTDRNHVNMLNNRPETFKKMNYRLALRKGFMRWFVQNNRLYMNTDSALSDGLIEGIRKLVARVAKDYPNTTKYYLEASDFSYDTDDDGPLPAGQARANLLGSLGLVTVNEKLDIKKDIQFHSELNPALWDGDQMIPEVADHLRQIAHVFEEFLDLPDLDVLDITVSGSNAAYTYTEHSDVDLHLVVDVAPEDQEFMRKYVDAKKNLFNEQHNITVHGQPVEVYVQFSDQPHASAGVYSLKTDQWIEQASPVKASIEHADVRSKLRYYIKAIKQAIGNKDLAEASHLKKRISEYRKEGLSSTGEFGTANLVFKILRNHGYLEKLSEFQTRQQDLELSIKEENI